MNISITITIEQYYFFNRLNRNKIIILYKEIFKFKKGYFNLIPEWMYKYCL